MITRINKGESVVEVAAFLRSLPDSQIDLIRKALKEITEEETSARKLIDSERSYFSRFLGPENEESAIGEMLSILTLIHSAPSHSVIRAQCLAKLVALVEEIIGDGWRAPNYQYYYSDDRPVEFDIRGLMFAWTDNYCDPQVQESDWEALAGHAMSWLVSEISEIEECGEDAE